MTGGNSAFPTPGIKRDDGVVLEWPQPGLTKREFFAALAMQGLCAAQPDMQRGTIIDEDEIASDAVACADALLKELAKAETKAEQP